VIDFVARVRGCDRKEALAWLAEYAGVPLDGQTDSTQRDWAARLRAVRPEAEALVCWKQETLEAYRCQRNRIQHTYHAAVRFVLQHSPEECAARGDVRYELALTIGETYWQRVEELDGIIDRVEAASYEYLLLRIRGESAK
jgi:hypothetical protein